MTNKRRRVTKISFVAACAVSLCALVIGLTFSLLPNGGTAADPYDPMPPSVPTDYWSNNYATDWDGWGWSFDPVIITTSQQFAGFLLTRSTQNAFAILQADIDLSEHIWVTPYEARGGIATPGFGGAIIGNGHEIIMPQIIMPNEAGNSGLLGATVNATFSDIRFSGDTEIRDGEHNTVRAGGVVSSAVNTSFNNIDNQTNLVVTGSSTITSVGGIAGQMRASTMDGVVNRGNIIVNEVAGITYGVGGLAGSVVMHNFENNNAIINSANYGDITVGVTVAQTKPITVEVDDPEDPLYPSFVDYIPTGGGVGGFVGNILQSNQDAQLVNLAITNSYNRGDITTSTANPTSGFVGNVLEEVFVHPHQNHLTFNNLFNLGETTGHQNHDSIVSLQNVSATNIITSDLVDSRGVIDSMNSTLAQQMELNSGTNRGWVIGGSAFVPRHERAYGFVVVAVDMTELGYAGIPLRFEFQYGERMDMDVFSEFPSIRGFANSSSDVATNRVRYLLQHPPILTENISLYAMTNPDPFTNTSIIDISLRDNVFGAYTNETTPNTVEVPHGTHLFTHGIIAEPVMVSDGVTFLGWALTYNGARDGNVAFPAGQNIYVTDQMYQLHAVYAWTTPRILNIVRVCEIFNVTLSSHQISFDRVEPIYTISPHPEWLPDALGLEVTGLTDEEGNKFYIWEDVYINGEVTLFVEYQWQVDRVINFHTQSDIFGITGAPSIAPITLRRPTDIDLTAFYVNVYGYDFMGWAIATEFHSGATAANLGHVNATSLNIRHDTLMAGNGFEMTAYAVWQWATPRVVMIEDTPTNIRFYRPIRHDTGEDIFFSVNQLVQFMGENIPQQTGYRFVGWKAGDVEVGRFQPTRQITLSELEALTNGTLVLQNNFERYLFTVNITFEDDSGRMIDQIIRTGMQEGDTITLPTLPVGQHVPLHEFIGFESPLGAFFAPGAVIVVPNGDITLRLTDVHTRTHYRLTFEPGGGNNSWFIDVPRLTATIVPDGQPVWLGGGAPRFFSHWSHYAQGETQRSPFPWGSELDRDVTVFAEWNMDVIQVHFDTGDSQYVIEPRLVLLGAGTEQPNDPVWHDLTRLFSHWAYDVAGNYLVNWTSLDQNREWTIVSGQERRLTLFAIWYDYDDPGITIITVQFNLNGGQWVTPPQNNPFPMRAGYPMADYRVPINPVRAGWTFVYWAQDGEEFDFNTILDESTILTAVWSQNFFTITFNLQGGQWTTDRESSVQIAEGASIQSAGHIPTNPTRNNYRFLRWATTQDGEMAFDFQTVLSGDITLYAIWELVDEGDYTPPQPSPDDDDDGIPFWVWIAIGGGVLLLIGAGILAFFLLRKKNDKEDDGNKTGVPPPSYTNDLTSGVGNSV